MAVKYTVWQHTYRSGGGWITDRTYRHRWRAALRAWWLRRTYPPDRRYGETCVTDARSGPWSSGIHVQSGATNFELSGKHTIRNTGRDAVRIDDTSNM